MSTGTAGAAWGIAIVEVVAPIGPTPPPPWFVALGATLGDAASDDGIGANLVGWSTRTGVDSACPAVGDAVGGIAIARLDTGEIDSRASADGRNGRSLRGGGTHVSILRS